MLTNLYLRFARGQNDPNTGVSEIMDVVIPHLANAIYRNGSSRVIKLQALDSLFDNTTDNESVHSHLPKYNDTKRFRRSAHRRRRDTSRAGNVLLREGVQ